MSTIFTDKTPNSANKTPNSANSEGITDILIQKDILNI